LQAKGFLVGKNAFYERTFGLFAESSQSIVIHHSALYFDQPMNEK
jgi:hypothetical protein